MEYIANTSKMRRASDTMELSFGSQIPLKLHFELPQGGYGTFILHQGQNNLIKTLLDITTPILN